MSFAGFGTCGLVYSFQKQYIFFSLMGKLCQNTGKLYGFLYDYFWLFTLSVFILNVAEKKKVFHVGSMKRIRPRSLTDIKEK